MNHGKVETFLKALKTDPKAASLLAAFPAPKTDADRLQAYAEIAKEMGHDISEAELEAYFSEMEKSLQERTKATEDLITKLSLDELEKTSGGHKRPQCKDTFRNVENCWYNDACDHIYRYYKEYICRNLDNCPEHAFDHYCREGDEDHECIGNFK